MSKWIDTTKLPDSDQRKAPIELIGQVIGTNGTAPYIHLQLEMSRRLFGDTMPTLIANDGDGPNSDKVAKLADEYGADFRRWPKLGHAIGDIRVFRESIEWASEKGLDIVAKFSRRFVPLVSWRHDLQYLAATNTDVGFFTRRHLDAPGGLFRTDAIAFRLRTIKTERVLSVLDETIEKQPPINVETMFEAFARTHGSWAQWDLLGPDFYKPWKYAMQWRGLLPYHYGDLSRQLGLPYTDLDFLPASALSEPGSEPSPEPVHTREKAAGKALVLQVGGSELQQNPPPTPETV